MWIIGHLLAILALHVLPFWQAIFSLESRHIFHAPGCVSRESTHPFERFTFSATYLNESARYSRRRLPLEYLDFWKSYVLSLNIESLVRLSISYDLENPRNTEISGNANLHVDISVNGKRSYG